MRKFVDKVAMFALLVMESLNVCNGHWTESNCFVTVSTNVQHNYVSSKNSLIIVSLELIKFE